MNGRERVEKSAAVSPHAWILIQARLSIARKTGRPTSAEGMVTRGACGMLSGSVSRAVWIVAFAAGLLAGPAWASKVVEVRIGNHPTFTRVVFELDAPAGYGIERRTVEKGVSEILVTLEAS